MASELSLLKRIRYKVGYDALARERRQINKDTFGGKQNLTLQDASDAIAAHIRSGEPMSVVRMGISELNWVSICLKEMPVPGWFFYAWVQGLFKTPEENQHYIDLIKDAYQTADYMANWYWSGAEGRLLARYAPQAVYCPTEVVEPYYLEHSWLEALAGKKVLIVHPFVETIRQQYKIKDKIYPNGLLPDCELITVPSVWYNTDGNPDYANWFEALAYLEAQVDKETYDIALLGCGPFGVPLTAHIKQQGRQAIYIGGALQILFGIRGNRWDGIEAVRNLYNEYWVRPGDDNKPRSTKDLDDNCYW